MRWSFDKEGVQPLAEVRCCTERHSLLSLDAVKSAGVVCDGYRVIFMSGQALSAGAVVGVVTSWVESVVVGTGRMRERLRTSRPR